MRIVFLQAMALITTVFVMLSLSVGSCGKSGDDDDDAPAPTADPSVPTLTSSINITEDTNVSGTITGVGAVNLLVPANTLAVATEVTLAKADAVVEQYSKHVIEEAGPAVAITATTSDSAPPLTAASTTPALANPLTITLPLTVTVPGLTAITPSADNLGVLYVDGDLVKVIYPVTVVDNSVRADIPGFGIVQPILIDKNDAAEASEPVLRLVADINPGDATSDPTGFTAFGGKVYFTADNGTKGLELWVYDGDSAPTMVFDINQQEGVSEDTTQGSQPFQLTVFKDKLYFRANDGLLGDELWVFDGTANPTMVIDLVSGATGSWPDYLTVIGETLYFSANDKVYTYDGAAEPAAIGGTFSSPSLLTNFNGKLYFVGYHESKYKLYSYDATDGTTLAATFTVEGNDFFPGSEPRSRLVHDGVLYFAALTGSSDTHLLAFNGTTLSSLVAMPEGDYGEWRYLFPYADKVFLVEDHFTNDPYDRSFFWPYDGTETIARGLESVIHGYGAELNGLLYYAGRTTDYGVELMVWDGESAEPTLAADIRSGAAYSYPTGFTAINNRLYFSADDGEHGYELYELIP